MSKNIKMFVTACLNTRTVVPPVPAIQDVEANTVRLKEHGQDVLVLEKIPSNTQTADGTLHSHYK